MTTSHPGGRAARPAVLLTGSARGIGRVTAATLARRGFLVFAGVRKPSDAEALRAELGDAVHPLLLEVTDGRALCEAVGAVEAVVGGRGLAGLVNNAAVGPMDPLEYTTPAQLEEVLRVNVVGLHAVTMAFLPALRRARGRIVNVSSVNGRVSVPFAGPYSASKHALEAMSDALRLELAPSGVRVVVVQPGAFDTTIRAEMAAGMLERLDARPAAERERYEARLRTFVARIDAMNAAAPHPQPVADAIADALTDPDPPARVPVGDDAAAIIGAARLPDAERDAMLRDIFGP